MFDWNKIMIKPDRHINPDISVINVSAFILKQLNAFYDINYDDLLKTCSYNLKYCSAISFSLNLLTF